MIKATFINKHTPGRVATGEREDNMKLNNEYNLKFMNHPERVAADKRLRKTLKHIEEIKTLSAQTILTCMPPALKELESAYENLNIVEAKIEIELLKEQAEG